MSILVFHGSNQPHTNLRAGSWITTDRAVAWHFAEEKAAESGGVPCVAEIVLAENAVDWDVLSAFLEIEDERGIIFDDASQIAWTFLAPTLDDEFPARSN
jgi:hypothetical protein